MFILRKDIARSLRAGCVRYMAGEFFGVAARCLVICQIDPYRIFKPMAVDDGEVKSRHS